MSWRMLAAAGVALSSVVAVGCSHSGGSSGSSGLSVAGATSQTPAAATAPAGTVTRPEYLEWQTSESMSAAQILAILEQTVGAATITSGTPAVKLPIRRGMFLTARPSGANTILHFDADGAGVRPASAYVEVAISGQLGRSFIEIVDAAMATASLAVQTPGLGEPWNLFLRAESATGGICEIGVQGDANGNFSMSWKLDSPVRPVDAFAPAVAFGPPGNPGCTEKVGGTVHFPIGKDEFKVYVNRAYGYNAPQRFTDFALVPHTWLLLTVTAADPSGRVVNVHFDAIANNGARLYVAEAPASTDLGGRFFDETTARMQEMIDEEAAQPGSSRDWGTSFYYADVAKGVVDVVVTGHKGQFDIAYAVETPKAAVTP